MTLTYLTYHEGGVITDTDMLDSTIAGFRALDPMDALEFYHLMATDAPAVARHAMEWHTARLREQTAPQVDTAMKVAPDVSPPIAALPQILDFVTPRNHQLALENKSRELGHAAPLSAALPILLTATDSATLYHVAGTGKDIVKALVKKGLGQAVVIEYPTGAGELTVLIKARFNDKVTWRARPKPLRT